METMTMSKENVTSPDHVAKPGPGRLLQCKCPRCRTGNMFVEPNAWKLKTTMKMNPRCPVCTQPLDIEVGFYYGSSYISYGLCIFISVITFVAWWLLVGISLNDNRVLYWIPVNAVILVLLQPYLMRVSRTLWLAFFVRYDRNWKTAPPQPLERTNNDQQNNW